MVKEIYCKLPSDFDYKKKLHTDDQVFMILQQIRVALGTRPGSVLGAYNFGIDLHKFLFRMDGPVDEIQALINMALAQYVVFDPDRYKVYVQVSYGHNHNEAFDYAVIDIVINEQKYMGVLVTQN